MLGPTYVLDKPLIAEGPITRYRALAFGSDDEHAVQATGAAQVLVGFSQEEEVSAEDVSAGRVVNVRVAGISYAVAGATLNNLGTPLTADSQGRVVPASAGNRIIGYNTTRAAAANDPVSVYVLPFRTA